MNANKIYLWYTTLILHNLDREDFPKSFGFHSKTALLHQLCYILFLPITDTTALAQ